MSIKITNIIYMGTASFGIPTLKVINENFNLSAIITNYDKPSGRGLKIKNSPVKDYAIKNKISFFQPKNLKDTDFINIINQLNPDFIIVVAFRMIPKSIWEIPKFGTINLHASLLPDYRGSAPINWVIINGERETGVTVFFINKKIDEGDIINKKKISISEDETAGSLHDKLMKEGAELLKDSIKNIFTKNIKREIQKITIKDIKAPKIKKKDCFIDFDLDDKNIIQLIKGLSPYPGARIIHNKKVFKIIDAKNTNNYVAEIGLNQIEDKIILNNNDRESIQITKIQEEGKKILNVKEYLKGNKL